MEGPAETEEGHGGSALGAVAALAEVNDVSRRGQGDAGWGVSRGWGRPSAAGPCVIVWPSL